MNLSYKWLKEYVDFDLTPEILAEKLTSSGIAVEGIINLSEELSNIVIGEVTSCEQHPNADKLSLCKVTDGQNDYPVVCGAENVAKGQKIVFAKMGATLPGDFTIKAAKIRGVASEGMICSAKEIGIPPEYLLAEQREGILVLDNEAPIGADAIAYLDLDDYVMELDLTPDRGDCLSIVNVARQVAAITGSQIKFPEIVFNEVIKESDKDIDITIEAQEDCPRYVGKIVENIQVGPSPFWIQNKLRNSGIRPISNVVDVTNYVLLELGQPLHAFDYEQLHGQQIIVRRAQKGETIVTLDEQERTLDDSMLLICDAVKPVAIAGVMGAENSEVTKNTQTVLIESAYFNPVSIRKTSTVLGLRSEASARFEKGINYEQTKLAAQRAAQLLAEVAGGVAHQSEIDVYPKPIEKVTVYLRFAKVNQLLGTSLTNEEIIDILKRLELELLEEKMDSVLFGIPAFRPDLRIEEDLIEEVASIFGLENIPITLPYGDTHKGSRNTDQKIRKTIFEVLKTSGANEIITYSFINRNHLDKILLPENDLRRNVVEVLNPLSEEQGVMRTTLVPGILDNALRNHNRKSENLLTFEVGKVYYKNGFPGKTELPEEEMKLSIFGRGRIAGDWKNKAEEIDFYYIKGITNALFSSLKLNDIEYVPVNDAGEYHPGRCAKILLGGTFIGYIGELNPKVADNYSLSGRNYLAELHLDTIINACEEKISYRYLPKYPGMNRDLAILIDDQIRAGQIVERIEETGGELLQNVEVFDLYQGAQIPEGKKSIAFSLQFQAEDRTLTDDEVSIIIEKIKQVLEETFAAKLRD